MAAFLRRDEPITVSSLRRLAFATKEPDGVFVVDASDTPPRDFQGRWEGWKTCFWFSRLSTDRHFHRFQVSSSWLLSYVSQRFGGTDTIPCRSPGCEPCP